jgi:hypothetical protein
LPDWVSKLSNYLANIETLRQKYKKERDILKVPITLNNGNSIELSPGEHSELIKGIIEEFGSRFAPGAELLYVGDTGEKFSVFDKKTFLELGLEFDSHGKFPDVILYWRGKNWLLLCESVTHVGPIDSKRHGELQNLFANSCAGLVFVTAFQNRKMMRGFLADISWETEVWIADDPTHLIHFDGSKFLGPYEE